MSRSARRCCTCSSWPATTTSTPVCRHRSTRSRSTGPRLGSITCRNRWAARCSHPDSSRRRFNERMRPVRLHAAWAIAFGTLLGATALAMGQLTERPIAGVLTHPAVGYYTTPTHDLVADLNRRIDEGSTTVAFDTGSGYLRATLEALHVPIESQMLVMSKTGIQEIGRAHV